MVKIRLGILSIKPGIIGPKRIPGIPPSTNGLCRYPDHLANFLKFLVSFASGKSYRPFMAGRMVFQARSRR